MGENDLALQQPEEPEGASPQPSGAAGEQDALLTAIDKRLADMEERIAEKVRFAQGKIDKADIKFREDVKKEIDDFNSRVQILKDAGMSVPQTEIDLELADIRRAALRSRMPEETPSRTSEVDKVQAVNTRMQETIAKYGILLTKDDPEAAGLDPTKHQDPEEYYKLWEKAELEKAARLGIITPPEARMVNTSNNLVGPTNPIANINDPKELFKLGLVQSMGKKK